MNDQPLSKKRCLFTIGHSNHSLEEFLRLLRDYAIEVLADVRSHPHSKYAPHFDYHALQEALEAGSIKYAFYGKELGGRPCEVVARPAPDDVAMPLLRANLVPGPELLGNDQDRIAYERFKQTPAQASLALVLPQDLRWIVQQSYRGGHQIQTRFHLGGTYYHLSVTDPVWEQRLAKFPLGVYSQEDVGLKPGDRVVFP